MVLFFASLISAENKLIGPIYQRCFVEGNCTIYDFITTLIAVSQWGLGILGSLALLFFVIGGLYLMFGGASPSARKKGKDMLLNTTLAIIVIFSSWLIVKFLLSRIFQAKPCVQPDATIEEIEKCKKEIRE